MKKYGILYCFYIFLLLPLLVLGQDRIITKKNQRIECKILPIKDKNFVYFQMLEDGELKYTLLPKSQIKKIDKNFYKNPILNLDKKPKSPTFHNLMISGRTGLGRMSYQIDPNASPQFKDFQNRERYGFVYDLEVSYMFSESFGMFAQFQNFSSSVNRTYQFINPGNPGNPSEHIFRSKQNMPSYSLGINYNTLFNEKALMSFGLALGQFHYKYFSDLDIFSLPATYTGSDLFYSLRVSGQYKLTDNLYIDGGINFISAALFSVKRDMNGSIETLDLSGSPWSLSRLNFMVGIRYGISL
ncbi:hypothetical protein JCM31826_04620 [Thermaurantimonas aggregans]|uniref:Outer membrane protein beta-barrel domain-containing protein n=1 Tax=Thermaurantimonas aggregans TaxID=2173829 RepID=A0A401XIZ6_9FLAO|nr:hypothetical protein [Thermaurantimonas aggregans]GCD76980.1 hypothetical protein JCM31826_04620 [Thermaurantimonas aggregans]